MEALSSKTQKHGSTIVGVFESQLHAQDAVRDLKAMGFSESDVGIVTKDNRKHHDIQGVPETESPQLAGAGLAAGAAVGALWSLGIATAVLPPLGMVVAGGVLANILASAAGGAAVAGVVAGLVGMGVPSEEAEFYENELKLGRTIVTVQAGDRVSDAAAVLQRNAAYDMTTRDTFRTTEVYRNKLATSPIDPSFSAIPSNAELTRLNAERARKEGIHLAK